MTNSIKSQRKKLKLSQTELANRLDVSRQTVYSLETGKFSPSTVLALKIAKVFGCKINEIFELEKADLNS